MIRRAHHRLRQLDDDRGEVSSWLLFLVGLVLAAGFASGVLSTTIGALASRVAAASRGEATELAAGAGSAADADLETETGASTDPVGQDSPQDRLTPEIASRIDALRAELGDDPTAPTDPSTSELYRSVMALFDDPDLGEQAYALVLEGAPIDIAVAQVTGNWAEVPGGDPGEYGDAEIRVILDMLGIDIPPWVEGQLPEDVSALLDALPDWLRADIFTQGREYELTLGVTGIGTPRTILPAGVGAEVTVGVTTELGDPRIGVGFTQTQSVEVTAQVLGGVEVSAGKSTIGRVYKILSLLDQVPEPLERLMQRSPWLRGVIKGLPFSVSYNQFAGTELAYEATISTGQGVQVEAGYLGELPNLYDPSSFEVGNSVLIRGGAIEGSTFAAKYKLLYGESTLTDFTGLGFGMTMLADGRFAVYSGPVEIVESELFLGIPVAGLVHTESLTAHDFDYAEIDLSTPEGQAAYAEFITGGGVPSTDGPGVVTATTEVITYDSELGFELRLGPLSGSSTFRDESTVRTVTTYSDDRRDYNVTFDLGQSAIEVTAPVGPGDIIDYSNSNVTIVFENIDDNHVSGLNHAFSQSVGVEDNQHVQIQFTAAQLNDLIVSADAALQQRGPQMYEIAIANPSAGDLVESLATASSPDEVAYALLRHTRHAGNYGTILELTRIGINVNGGIDGDIQTRPVESTD